jgi:D-arabinose 1-dehydrogenase-like Zn-dependent alcohol dehydrogenase
MVSGHVNQQGTLLLHLENDSSNQRTMAISYTVFRGSSNGEIKQAVVNHGELLPGEVLVRIEYSGVCGTDQHMRHMNVALGHEGVGVVENVAKDVLRVVM